MPDLDVRLYRDGGQTPAEVARQVADFFAAATRTLDLALYDIRLHDEAAEIVEAAFADAHDRGVSVRLVYNA
ncbi:MAG: hypothetical protein K0T00_1469, partial [Gaiellaceae bacterium]|nr:hypothetical protein [Gaiellaceae bacterium]